MLYHWSQDDMIFLRPEEAILKIWLKLVFIQLISVFWEIFDLFYTDKYIYNDDCEFFFLWHP